MSDTFKVSDISISLIIKKNIGLLLSGYTKAINKRYKRHGSLFQPHSKAKEIDDERYLLTLISYIHQNPVRSKLVTKAEEWKFSSYQDSIGIRNGSLPDREFIKQYFKSTGEFKKYSEEIVSSVRKEYWIQAEGVGHFRGVPHLAQFNEMLYKGGVGHFGSVLHLMHGGQSNASSQTFATYTNTKATPS